MYSLFLVLAVAVVILSPLALELWLDAAEAHRERKRRVVRDGNLELLLTSSRLHS